MHYTALYRKYRPRTFRDLVGQQHVAATLLNALRQQRVVHAYLFCGPRGTGKTSAAHIFARAVNCLAPQDGEPCGQCEACKRILAGQSLDIIEIDAASNRGINEMRDLRDGVKYTPAQEKYKVYIVDEVHMLTNEAFNALLKTLEEPPGYTIFLLATTEPHKVLPTVLSRCQRFDFHRIRTEDIIGRLQTIAAAEQLAVEEEALALIARRASGGLRDAIGLLDQCLTSGEGRVTATTVNDVLGSVEEEVVARLACAVANQDIETLLATVALFVDEGKDLRQILLQLLEYLREQLLESLKPQGNSQLPRRRLLQMLRDLVDADLKMRESQGARITLELALLNAARLEEEPVVTSAVSPQPTATKSAPSAPPPVADFPPAGEPWPPEPTEATVSPAMEGAPSASPQQKQWANDEELFAAVCEAWPQLLKQVKRRKVITHAFLQEGKPVEVKGDTLLLGFPARYALHMQTLLEDGHRRTVEKELAQLFGRPLYVKACLLEEAAAPLPEHWFGGDQP